MTKAHCGESGIEARSVSTSAAATRRSSSRVMSGRAATASAMTSAFTSGDAAATTTLIRDTPAASLLKGVLSHRRAGLPMLLEGRKRIDAASDLGLHRRDRDS